MKETSITKNILANFAGKAWSSLMSLIFIPFYIKFMGIESYGLIGIFISLTALISILDMGLSSTLSRELARLSVSRATAQESRDLVRTLEVVYWTAGILIGICVVCLSPIIAHSWLTPQGIATKTVEQAVMIMGLVVAIQWPSALYDGGLMGLQRQVVLNGVRGVMATIQHAGAVLVLWLISPSILAYFCWQICVSVLLTLLLATFTWRSLPITQKTSTFHGYLLKKNWRFAAGMMGISIMATLLTQVDKIILSKLLTLTLFGYYILALNLANIVVQLVNPFFSAFFPKLTQLIVDKKTSEAAVLYHKGCQLAASIVLPVSITVAFFSREIIRIWTNNSQLADNSYVLLSILVLGSTCNALLMMPYTLQLAYGWTKLIFYQNLYSVIILVPLMIYMVILYSTIGAAIVWLILNIGYVIILVPLMHRYLLKTELWKWYFIDTGVPFLLTFLLVLFSRLIIPSGLSVVTLSCWLLLTIVTAFICSIVTLPFPRSWIKLKLSP